MARRRRFSGACHSELDSPAPPGHSSVLRISPRTTGQTSSWFFQLYCYVEETTSNGGEVYIREPKDSEPRLLKMLNGYADALGGTAVKRVTVESPS